MAIIRCKMCGGTVDFTSGETVGVCEFCGTKQTLPKADDEVITNLFNRANNLRLKCEFDKAEQIYEKIVQQDDSEAEAHWGIILCKYGIEYVEDPKTFERIPTCHRTKFESIKTDADYEAAIDYADMLQQSIYEKEAREIDKLQKDILAIVKSEEPFDVFICYKETDDTGQRTVDSVLANDIYYQLTREGLRVFYAAITLEDKLGQEYEPYIFAALNSARVMLTIGTKPEYYTSVWVKNEWSRFMNLMKTDSSKILIPCYRDMDAYDLPEEFAHLQAQDMSKIGFIQDIIRGVKKVVKKGVNAAESTDTIVQASVVGVAPLIKRAFMFLGDGEWENATSYFERILDQEPENGQAYLGKLMAELRVKTQSALADCDEPFDGFNNYRKAVSFGGAELENELNGYIETIKERNEAKGKQIAYDKAVSKMNSAKTEEEYKNAADTLNSVSGFRDADVLAEECLSKAEAVRQEVELVISALLEGPNKTVLSIEAAIKEAIKKKTMLEALAESFSSINDRIGYKRDDLGNTETKIKSLAAERTGLGLFGGKKKRIDLELAELDNKRKQITSDIEQLTTRLKGYTSKSQIDVALTQVAETIKNQEENLQKERENSANKYSYEQAVVYCRNNPDIYRQVIDPVIRSVCPAFEFVIKSSGDSVIFGNYYQQSESSKEPIEWKILAKEDNRVLIISKYALDRRRYNTYNHSDESITWETCSLRKWLNGRFLENAFSLDERKMILKTIVAADANTRSRNDAGNDTEDSVFILSITEANKYFSSNNARSCQGTQYCFARGALKGGLDTCFWWLRTPGEKPRSVSWVDCGGSIQDYGAAVDEYNNAVRPALWINLER